jgi:hypothetical protein
MHPKLCKDCTHSVPDTHSPWTLRCKNPIVNAKDPWALSYTEFTGSSCREEREKTWFAPCGQKGKLYEKEYDVPLKQALRELEQDSITTVLQVYDDNGTWQDIPTIVEQYD